MATLYIVTPLSPSRCYRHYGVEADGYVYHLNETKGVSRERAAEFFAEREILYSTPATRSDAEVERYYEQNKNRRYNRFTYNCEHFATEAAFGVKSSPTLKGYLVGAIVLVFTVVAVWLRYKHLI